MDKLEKRLRPYAIYSPDDYKEANVENILSGYEYEKKYMGQLSRVYVIKDTPWIMKEGRWDLSFELVGDKRIPVPAKLSEAFLKQFSFTFLPRKQQILDEYKRYLSFAQYFGYFKDDKTYYHPNRELIFAIQKNIRNSLLFFRPELEKKYNFGFDLKIEEVLSSAVKEHNFLPKEFQLAGKSISPENKGQVTSMIFQEFIKGDVLRKLAYRDMSTNLKKQLILMIYLILLMHYQTGLMADTRPKYSFIEAWDWLTRTENVLISKDEKMYFIDTRWFWDTKSNFIRQGNIIPSLVIQNAKTKIQELLSNL